MAPKTRFLALIACLLVSTTAYAQRYFPLDEGAKWTYTGDVFGDTWVNSVVAIDEEGIVTFSRRRPEVEIAFQENGSVISVQLEGATLDCSTTSSRTRGCTGVSSCVRTHGL